MSSWYLCFFHSLRLSNGDGREPAYPAGSWAACSVPAAALGDGLYHFLKAHFFGSGFWVGLGLTGGCAIVAPHTLNRRYVFYAL
jgi:hypothetical protein